MARYKGPDCRKCRSLGRKLMLKGSKCVLPKCPVERRKKSPGPHGAENRKMSVYAEHLREKQRVKFMYGLNEAQMKINFKRAEKQKGSTGENFLSILERRLDNIVYRLGIAESRDQARQLVRYGKIYVDGKRISIPSYLVCEGQVIMLAEKFRQNAGVLKAHETNKGLARLPFLEYDAEKRTGKVLRLPSREDLGDFINEQLIVEFYSR